jgi:predicted membrane-bound spermidine synthase
MTQVFLIREANVWLRGNEFIIASIVAAWLMWMATGSMLGYQVLRLRRPVPVLITVWLLALTVSVSELVLLRCFWTYTGGVPGESINLSRAAGLSFAVTAVPCLLSGSVFGGAVRWYEQYTVRSVAYLYMVEAFGAFIAGILITFFLLPFEYWWLSLALLAGLPLLYGSWTVPSCSARIVFLLMFLFLCLSIGAGNDTLERAANRLSGRYLVGVIAESRDTPRERITVITHGGEAAFYFDGRLCGSSISAERAEELGWYAILSCPTPRNALLIGFPFNGLIRELLRKKIQVTVTETRPEIIQAVADYLSPADQAVLTSTAVRIIPVNSREYIHTCAAAGTGSFDIILQDIGIPESYGGARLFSTEWFRDLATCLTTNGTCIVVLPGSAGYVPDELARILERVRTTMQTVFSTVITVPASQTLLIGSQSKELTTDEYFWLDRWSTYNVSSVWFSTALLSDNLNSFRVRQFTNACNMFAGMPAHTDRMPLTYGDALRYSEARFHSGIRQILSLLYDNPVRVLIIFVIVLAMAVLTGWSAGIGGSSRLYLFITMSLLSAAGLIGEMMIVIRIVIMQGSVTYVIGLLFGVFIFGLSCAAFVLQHVARQVLKPAGLLAGFILACVIYMIIFLPWPAGDTGIVFVATVLNLFCGMCVGTYFTVCARLTQNTRGTGIVLYMADLLGAFTGGLLFSIVIPPALGFNYLALLYAGTLLLLAPSLILFRK